MSNVYAFHPVKSPLINLYEIVEEGGGAEWGGNDPYDAMLWLKLAPEGSRVLVSGWESDEEEAHIVGQPIDITDIIKQAREMGR
jgi:hypothetical protein